MPEPPSVPAVKVTGTERPVVAVGVADRARVGAVESLMNDRFVTAVLPATSRPVTASPGALVVPAVQLNVLET